jgi:hypothetical protein
MDHPNNTTGTLDQADEEILTCTASDEALEAAAGTGGVARRGLARPPSRLIAGFAGDLPLLSASKPKRQTVSLG